MAERRGEMVHTEQRRHFLERTLKTEIKHSPAYPAYQEDKFKTPRDLDADDLESDDLVGVARRLEHVYRSSAAVSLTPDQAAHLADTSLGRALALYARGALEGRDVILLGDDSLVSLAIAFLGQIWGVPLARRIVVVEADPAWIGLIRTAAGQEKLDIECVRHDLRDPLPAELVGQFDTFETDPPYTAAGIALFVSRAIQALKPGAGRQGLLSFGHKPLAQQIDVQSYLARMGLAACEAFPASEALPGALLPGGLNPMIYVLTTPATRALLPHAPYEGALYAGESSLTVRFCVCTRCKARYRVGQQNSLVTIESLKATGCARCGHTRFRYVQRIAVQPNRMPSIALLKHA